MLTSNYRAMCRYRSIIRYLVIHKILRADAQKAEISLWLPRPQRWRDCKAVAQRRKHTQIAKLSDDSADKAQRLSKYIPRAPGPFAEFHFLTADTTLVTY